MLDATFSAMAPPAPGRASGGGPPDAAPDAGPMPPGEPAAQGAAEEERAPPSADGPRPDKGLEAALDETEHLWQAGKLSEALDVLMRLLASAELGNYRGDEGRLLTRIALLHEDMGDVPKALEFHFRRLEMALKQPYSEGQKAQIRCYDNISYLYLKQGKDVQFRTYCEKSEQVRREMLRFEAESRMPSRALSDAEEHEQQHCASLPQSCNGGAKGANELVRPGGCDTSSSLSQKTKSWSGCLHPAWPIGHVLAMCPCLPQ
eukprot:Tamp_10787.p2 GENE.Tamp_10787~~Tamp_10787.p2  ORF type:complete len:261 (+),score=56.81 Tamp_10787:744-1526(+)